MNTVERFTDRVANYIRYRPGYPAELLDLFIKRMGLQPDSVIADIGSGPGISARIFLDNGNRVYGVEPNYAMRAAAEDLLSEYEAFVSVNGCAEETTLPADSIDILVAAQAFHWFDRKKAATEFKRVVRPGGYVALIWNERQLDSTQFLREYEQLVLRFATDYDTVRHENITEDMIDAFFGTPFERVTFPNKQVFDLVGLRGRMFSSSYIPAEGTPEGGRLEKELIALFTKHSAGGKIEVLYDTNIFYCKL